MFPHPNDNLSADSGNWTNLSRSLLVAEHSALFELNCHIKANPWIDQVIWHVNGAPITPPITSLPDPFYSSTISASTFSAQFEAHASSKRAPLASSSSHHTPVIYLTNHNQTLRIENVARFHAGHYQCSARNAINLTHSEMVQLNVACKYRA